jgi:DNA polymerase-3 subunit delta
VTALKPRQVDGFLAKPDPHRRAVLIYGPDRGAVAERTRKLVAAVAGSSDDPFAVERLTDAVLGEDLGRLEDEARAIPMMGGPRVVWVEQAGTHLANALKTYLKDQAPQAWVIAEAAALPPSAKLRQIFEKAKDAVALPCYADTSHSIDELIDEETAARGLRIAPEARYRLAAILGADRGLSRSELEKLCLYCHGQGEITVDDVDAICGDVSALGLDDLVDHTFEGDLARMDADFSRLLASGTAVQAVIAALFNHIAKLSAVQAELPAKRSFDAAIGGLRPPLHFTRKSSFKKQIASWPAEKLRRAAAATAEIEHRSRRSDGLSETILARHLLSLAHAAR